jgi:hypothetical protein
VKSAPEAAPQATQDLPLTPEQRPAVPPAVTFLNGKLTIIANNANLGEILRVVGEKTGAAIDVPEGANERVVSQLGPGMPRDVIAALLNGSHFNYLVVGTEADPDAVARVVLTAKSEHADTGPSSPAGALAAAQNRSIMPRRNPLQEALMQPAQEIQPAAPPATVEFQTPPPPPVAEPAAAPASPTAEAAPAAGGAGGGETAPVDAAAAADGSQKNNNADKTPQQLMMDMFETRRQMMQQQQPRAAAPNPQPQADQQ